MMDIGGNQEEQFRDRERMKQSMASTSYSLSTGGFDDKELEVAEILRDFGNQVVIFDNLDSNPQISVNWVNRRRRSALNSSPPPSTSSSIQRSGGGGEREIEKRRSKVKAEVEASMSPDTPLSFPPSESDEKSKLSSPRKSSKKRNKEDWLEIVNELTERRDLLRGEVENVKCYYDKLMADNQLLKAKLKELSMGVENQSDSHLGISKSFTRGSRLSPHKIYRRVDQTAHGSKTVENFQYPSGPMHHLLSSGSGLGLIHHVNLLEFHSSGSYGLDCPPQPSDQNRSSRIKCSEAAEARKRRMKKMKEMKNPHVTIKPPRFR